MAMRPLVGMILASLWLGAALLLAGSVAPTVFATLPSHVMAGAVVGHVLPVVFLSGLFGGVIVAATALQGAQATGRRARVGFAVVWGLACGVAQFVVTPRIHQLQMAIGGSVDALARDDVRRVVFSRLHGTILGVFGIAIIAAAVVVILSLHDTRAHTPNSSPSRTP